MDPGLLMALRTGNQEMLKQLLTDDGQQQQTGTATSHFIISMAESSGGTAGGSNGEEGTWNHPSVRGPQCRRTHQLAGREDRGGGRGGGAAKAVDMRSSSPARTAEQEIVREDSSKNARNKNVLKQGEDEQPSPGEGGPRRRVDDHIRGSSSSSSSQTRAAHNPPRGKAMFYHFFLFCSLATDLCVFVRARFHFTTLLLNRVAFLHRA